MEIYQHSVVGEGLVSGFVLVVGLWWAGVGVVMWWVVGWRMVLK